jgi:hypothetical protein
MIAKSAIDDRCGAGPVPDDEGNSIGALELGLA